MNIIVGDLVAFNKLEDATWFEVLDIIGYIILIREAGTNYAEQFSDISLVRQHKIPEKN